VVEVGRGLFGLDQGVSAAGFVPAAPPGLGNNRLRRQAGRLKECRCSLTHAFDPPIAGLEVLAVKGSLPGRRGRCGVSVKASASAPAAWNAAGSESAAREIALDPVNLAMVTRWAASAWGWLLARSPARLENRRLVALDERVRKLSRTKSWIRLCWRANLGLGGWTFTSTLRRISRKSSTPGNWWAESRSISLGDACIKSRSRITVC